MDQRGKEMVIYVKVFTGKVLKVVVRSWETVECMKEKIWAKEGILMFKQRIIFKGTELQNHWIVIDRFNEIRNNKLKNNVSGSGRVVCHLLLRQTGRSNVVFHKPEQERRTHPHRPSSDSSDQSSSSSSSSDLEAPNVIPQPRTLIAPKPHENMQACLDIYGASTDAQTGSNESTLDTTSPEEGQSILTILRGAGKDINLIVVMIVMAAFFLPKIVKNKVPHRATKVNPSDTNGKHDENKTELVEMVLERLKDGGGISLSTILLVIIISDLRHQRLDLCNRTSNRDFLTSLNNASADLNDVFADRRHQQLDLSNGGSDRLRLLLVILYFRVAEEKRSVQVEIIKGSKKVKFTISDIVDVVPVKRGHKVPTDGILVIGRSVGIHESINLGKIIHVRMSGEDLDKLKVPQRNGGPDHGNVDCVECEGRHRHEDPNKIIQALEMIDRALARRRHELVTGRVAWKNEGKKEIGVATPRGATGLRAAPGGAAGEDNPAA
ncbi:hypothetical protein Sjap_022963 [Stephania japonica]|uniref:Ubiquitin-like domain-containing protein n=1 Tax=Stephania japonica TaxID=461633 RepID=A0AAP0EQD4_9MAGN